MKGFARCMMETGALCAWAGALCMVAVPAEDGARTLLLGGAFWMIAGAVALTVLYVSEKKGG